MTFYKYVIFCYPIRVKEEKRDWRQEIFCKMGGVKLKMYSEVCSKNSPSMAKGLPILKAPFCSVMLPVDNSH